MMSHSPESPVKNSSLPTIPPPLPIGSSAELGTPPPLPQAAPAEPAPLPAAPEPAPEPLPAEPEFVEESPKKDGSVLVVGYVCVLLLCLAGSIALLCYEFGGDILAGFTSSPEVPAATSQPTAPH